MRDTWKKLRRVLKSYKRASKMVLFCAALNHKTNVLGLAQVFKMKM